MLNLRWISFFMAVFLWVACGNNNVPDAKVSEKDSAGAAEVQLLGEVKHIVFFGNSLTAGYGLDPSQAFPALIQQRIDSLKLPYLAVNDGLSGETSAGGNTRVEWILKQPVEIFVLELGANDGLRGIPLDETVRNLQSIIDKVKAAYPTAKIVLAGMQVPPNMGKAYSDRFRSLYGELAEKNKAALVPFLLEGVGGIPELNQGDGIHPTAEGHLILAENVWKVLKELL
ncbi:arylesterase [Parasegetibacter sp. NRK P23]|uniref:arylesterase n=1 Tax=Parasegetibacter sp. NRK P23 TaxID=2942999 RepID=UPI0020440096|nr:arylesterase [Parasegetibacter sp. NRK P23]MCM5526823.1 arylesterase [Parasegetibacter sp. NRK P23]